MANPRMFSSISIWDVTVLRPMYILGISLHTILFSCPCLATTLLLGGVAPFHYSGPLVRCPVFCHLVSVESQFDLLVTIRRYIGTKFGFKKF